MSYTDLLFTSPSPKIVEIFFIASNLGMMPVLGKPSMPLSKRRVWNRSVNQLDTHRWERGRAIAQRQECWNRSCRQGRKRTTRASVSLSKPPEKVVCPLEWTRVQWGSKEGKGSQRVRGSTCHREARPIPEHPQSLYRRRTCHPQSVRLFK